MKKVINKKARSTRQKQKVKKRYIKKAILCIIALMVFFVWKLPLFAKVIYVCLMPFLNFDVFNVFTKKGNRIHKIFFCILIALFCVSATRTELDISNESKDNDSGKSKTLNNEEIKVPAEVAWGEDIYLLDLGTYVNFSIEDEEEWVRQAILKYIGMVKKEKKISVKKSDDELNGGKFGDFIYEANGYAEDYKNCKMKKTKIAALEGEIKARENANNEYIKYDNLKVMGDLYIRKTEVEDLQNDQKVEILEVAIKKFISAIESAYQEPRIEGKEISKIWNALSDAYQKIACLDAGDKAHRERALVMAKVCISMVE